MIDTTDCPVCGHMIRVIELAHRKGHPMGQDSRKALRETLDAIPIGARTRAVFRDDRDSTVEVIGDLYENSAGVRLLGGNLLLTAAGVLNSRLISLAAVGPHRPGDTGPRGEDDKRRLQGR